MHKSTDSLPIEVTPIEQKSTAPHSARIVSSYLTKGIKIIPINYKNVPPKFVNVYLQTKDKNIIGMYVQQNQEDVYKKAQSKDDSTVHDIASHFVETELEAHLEAHLEEDMQNSAKVKEGDYTDLVTEDVMQENGVEIKTKESKNNNQNNNVSNDVETNSTAIEEEQQSKKTNFIKANAKSIANKITVSAKNFKSFIAKSIKQKSTQKKSENTYKNTSDIFPKQILLYIHGMMQNRQTFVKYLPVDSFDMLNYTLVIPDLRSFGECNHTYNKNGFNTDIERIIEYLNKKYDNPNITLIGHCLGAGIVLNYCKYLQGTINTYEPKVVLISPTLNEKECIKKSHMLKMYGIVKRIDYEKVMSDMTNDTMKLIKCKEKNNVIIFHGKKDKVNNIEDGIKIANEIGCKIYRSENDDYTSILGNEEVVRKIDEFCKM